MSLDDRLRARLADLEARGLRRELPEISERRGVEYSLRGRRVVGFCSNDYLGLAGARFEPTQPAGAGASRLISGDHPIHRDLEARLATLAGCEDAVIFPSGFQLNSGVLPALVEPGDAVHSDALNHASIIDGLRLARVRPTILAHATAPSAPRGTDGLHWWATESIFSMDGDAINPETVAEFERAGGVAYVDEAHALGLFSEGRGLLAAHGVTPTFLVGTFSKALGCAGAFVAASRTACHVIRTRARSFVFSTGISPILAELIDHRLRALAGPDGAQRREALWTNVAHLSARLGLPKASPSPIFPLLIGSNHAAVEVAQSLVANGFHVQAIRPPTVPEGTARLRLTVTAAHTPSQIDALADALGEQFTQHGAELRVMRGTPAAAGSEHRS